MKIALVGNQNSGKTTLFNVLTGSHQKIGNWAGVTIEKKEGVIRSTDFDIIDLPGLYSLNPYTAEEEISFDYLLYEHVDLILNVIDATQLERSLYLTTQLLELDIPLVIALNMKDLADLKGIKIDYQLIEEKLNTSIIALSALKKTGVFDLIQLLKNKAYKDNQYTHIYDHAFEDVLKEVTAEINVEHSRFISTKLIENDERFISLETPHIKTLRERIRKSYNRELDQVITDERYRYIEQLRDDAIKSYKTNMSWTDRIDLVLLNKYLALPIFAGIMFLIYYLAAGPFGSMTVDWVGSLFEQLSSWLGDKLVIWNASPWAQSLVIDGIIAGVGAVLNFVPQLIILFTLIAILETTGYMSRIAFFLDRLFQKIGLSGKSLIPFIIGSGCSVPAIMASRTINDETEKRMTIMLTPFIPCSAKLPIITLFAGYFFSDHTGLISASLYFFAIAIIILSAYIMKTFIFKGNISSFIMELPHYKAPNFRYVLRDVYMKVKAFITEAGSIILMASIVIWFLLSFSLTMQYNVSPNQSILSYIGRLFSWLFYPFLGELSWGASVSAIQGLVAKEQVISSMAIIANFSDEVTSGTLIFNSQIFQFFTPASAYAFMVFNLFSAPCFGAIGAMKRELGLTKRMWQAVLFQTGIAWVLATLVYQIGTLLGG